MPISDGDCDIQGSRRGLVFAGLCNIITVFTHFFKGAAKIVETENFEYYAFISSATWTKKH